MINYSENNKNLFLDNDEMVQFQDTGDIIYELIESLENIAENYELKGENAKINKAELITTKKVLYLLAENDDIIIKKIKKSA